jgi:hypothetical protein
MKLSVMQKSDRAFAWMCQDFSDGESCEEKFAAKFKNPEIADEFKKAFDAAIDHSHNDDKKASDDRHDDDDDDDKKANDDRHVDNNAKSTSDDRHDEFENKHHPDKGCL